MIDDHWSVIRGWWKTWENHQQNRWNDTGGTIDSCQKKRSWLWVPAETLEVESGGLSSPYDPYGTHHLSIKLKLMEFNKKSIYPPNLAMEATAHLFRWLISYLIGDFAVPKLRHIARDDYDRLEKHLFGLVLRDGPGAGSQLKKGQNGHVNNWSSWLPCDIMWYS